MEPVIIKLDTILNETGIDNGTLHTTGKADREGGITGGVGYSMECDLLIRDCNHQVSLDFGVWNANSQHKFLYKLDKKITKINKLIAHIEKTKKYLMDVQRKVLQDKPKYF